MKNDTLRNLLISAAVFVLILQLFKTIVPPPPSGTKGRPGGSPSTATGSAGDSTSPASASVSKPPSSSSARFTVAEAEAPVTRRLGADLEGGLSGDPSEVPYRMEVVLTSVGASVETVRLTDHRATLDSDERYVLLAPVDRPGGTSFTSLGVETINVDGEVIRVGDRMWRAGEVEPFEEGASRGQRVAFTLDILREGDPVVRVVRTYALPQQPRSMHRHDLRSEVTIENLDGNKHQVIVAFRGGMGVPKEGTRIDDRYVDCGIHDGVRVVGNRQRPSSVARKKGEPVRLFAPDPGEPDKALSWAALGNRYFTCTIAPVDAKAARSKAYAEVAAVDLDARAETSDDVTVRFTTLPVTVQPGAKTSFPLDLYLGEKDGRAFKTLEPYRSRNYYFQVAQGYGWCTFTWLVELMIGLLNGMYAVASKVGLGDYGLAIIVLVLIVRLLLHPITKKGQVNMVRMQEGMADLAPKMEELKRKFGNDKVRLQQETMKLYREKGINPATQVLSCLPMFIQMPIWVALYLSLTNNILMRHQPLHFTWVRDLTAPDALYTFSSPITIPLLGWTIPSFNLLPLLVAVFMYTQQKLQPKPEPNPNMSEQQKQQQEMMQKMGPLMSIMMLLIFYKMPSGLNLYIMASSLFGTIEQHRIRRHIKEAKEKGTLLQPAAKPAETVRPRRRRREEMGFFEKLQKMAEEAQKAQPKRPAKDKRRKR